MRSRPRTRGRVFATFTTAVAAAFAGVLTLAAPAAAAPQTETMPLADIGAAPANGTLPNQVDWSIDIGQWADAYWHQNNNTTATWTFDRPVDLRFGIDGLNGNENVELPAGTVLETLHANHAWDPNTFTVSHAAGACSSGCVSTFTLEDTTALTTRTFGSNLSRGVAFIEVTYNLPVAGITAPEDGGTYTVGGGDTLEFSCADGTGAVTGTATIDGQPIEAGAPIDQLGPGTHTIEVTCTDEFGATHTTSVTFDVVLPACLEDGLAVTQDPNLALGVEPPLASGQVHGSVEPLVAPLNLNGLVHDVNCNVVEPVEDLVDDVTVPLVQQLKKALGGLLG